MRGLNTEQFASGERGVGHTGKRSPARVRTRDSAQVSDKRLGSILCDHEEVWELVSCGIGRIPAPPQRASAKQGTRKIHVKAIKQALATVTPSRGMVGLKGKPSREDCCFVWYCVGVRRLPLRSTRSIIGWRGLLYSSRSPHHPPVSVAPSVRPLRNGRSMPQAG